MLCLEFNVNHSQQSLSLFIQVKLFRFISHWYPYYITLKEETFAILGFLAKFVKVCSREIFVIYKPQKFILAKKKEEF